MTDIRPTPAGPPEASPVGPEGADSTHAPEVKARTQWQLFRRKFLRHKLAMGSVIVLGVITFAAVFAEYVAPYGFNDINVTMRDTGPTLTDQHYLGPIGWAGTTSAGCCTAPGRHSRSGGSSGSCPPSSGRSSGPWPGTTAVGPRPC